ncbi:MAG: O-antigen ligase family protein, partial [Candidatus Methylomirabilia bacterium]
MRSLERGIREAFVVGLGISISLAQSALAALVALQLLRLRDPQARSALVFPLAGPFLGFIAAGLLSAFLSADVSRSLYLSKDLLLIAVFFLLVNTLRGPAGAEWLLGRLLLVMAGVSVWSVLQVGLCSPEPWPVPLLDRWLTRCWRARGFYSIYMTLAGVLTLVLLASLPRFLVRGSAHRRWELPAWVLMLLALVLTLTRGAWVGFLGGVAGLASLVSQRRVVVLAGGSILLLFLLVAVGTATLGRGIGLRNLADPTTVRDRLYMWQAGVRMMEVNPITGIGRGQVRYLYPRYVSPQAPVQRRGHLHNSPLQVLVERGLLGFGCWLWLWGAFFARGLGILKRAGSAQLRERALVTGSLAAILGFLVAGLTEFNFGDAEVVMVAYALMTIP